MKYIQQVCYDVRNRNVLCDCKKKNNFEIIKL